MHIVKQPKLELFTYESIQDTIDYQYEYALKYFYYLTLSFVMLFMIPFATELFYIDSFTKVPPNEDSITVDSFHIIVSFICLIGQLNSFINAHFQTSKG